MSLGPAQAPTGSLTASSPAFRRKGRAPTLRVLVAGFAALGCIATAAAEAVPSRAQTLDDDLSGPAIDWLGIVAAVIHDDDDTCFVLDRLVVGVGDYSVGRDPAFLARSSGDIEDDAYLPGATLHVSGNLGVARQRRAGDRVLDIPLVAAAYVEPAAGEASWAEGYPYGYDPWYGPPWYYPPGLSFGYFYFHGGHHHR